LLDTEHAFRLLNMESVNERVVGDLTTRARIIRAAMRSFGERGFAGATVRDIAAEVGVSGGLVLHHFGSKDGLRAECDRRVVDFVRGKRRAGSSAAATLSAAFAEYGLYAARTIGEDSTGSRELFETLLAEARAAVAEGADAGSMRGSSDPEAQAAALLVLGLGPFAFATQLSRWAAADTETAMRRLAVPLAEIYTHGLLRDDEALDAARGARGEQP
jgi:AcrR family transcriptional regulator